MEHQIQGVALALLQDLPKKRFCEACLQGVIRYYVPMDRREPPSGSVLEVHGRCTMCGQSGPVFFWQDARAAASGA